jgi:hypothetical protein
VPVRRRHPRLPALGDSQEDRSRAPSRRLTPVASGS